MTEDDSDDWVGDRKLRSRDLFRQDWKGDPKLRTRSLKETVDDDSD